MRKRDYAMSRAGTATAAAGIVALVLLLCLTTDASGEDVVQDQFIIGMWKPSGWAGLGENRDISFTALDRLRLETLGINLLANTPHLGKYAMKADSSQSHEKRLMAVWAEADSAGFVVRRAPNTDEGHISEDFGCWTLMDYAGCDTTCPMIDDSTGRIFGLHHGRLGKMVQALVDTLEEDHYVGAFWGYFLGEEDKPRYDSNPLTGGIYDPNTYCNLKTVMDSIRAHDTTRRILVVGKSSNLGAWSLDEQAVFRDTFFRPSNEDAALPNVLVNHCYVLWCTSTSETGDYKSVQSRVDTAIVSMDRAWDMVRVARESSRKAEWYHKYNINNQFVLEDTLETDDCSWKADPPDPFYRIPKIAELKAQANLALMRGATGICYFTYTSQPESLFSYSGANWYHGLMKWAGEGSSRDKRSENYFDSLAAFHNTLHVVGDTLYALQKRAPLSWKEKFTVTMTGSTYELTDSSTYIDTVFTDGAYSTGSMEFAAFADTVAGVDYLMAVNRWGLLSGTGSRDVELWIQTNNLLGAAPSAGAYTLEG
jgi:hypothetical protein